MQNLVVLMEPDSEDNGRITWMFDRSEPYQTSYKTGNMLLNRFCIDEDAAFELSGVNYLTNIPFRDHLSTIYPKRGRTPYEAKLAAESENMRNVKGREYSFLWSYYILRSLTLMNNL